MLQIFTSAITRPAVLNIGTQIEILVNLTVAIIIEPVTILFELQPQTLGFGVINCIVITQKFISTELTSATLVAQIACRALSLRSARDHALTIDTDPSLGCT
ncbi:hypothetical protein HN588_08115 [Candidatus Bathyarchaeota archaeon]|nr:hypothetical protein [Candidatus Bathyarchaeota archaeon]